MRRLNHHKPMEQFFLLPSDTLLPHTRHRSACAGAPPSLPSTTPPYTHSLSAPQQQANASPHPREQPAELTKAGAHSSQPGTRTRSVDQSHTSAAQPQSAHFPVVVSSAALYRLSQWLSLREHKR
ncbi:uncharacterized protein MONOS_12370 [Monocercomonoides exilis]|uniref:uncharacterized protein n=1 Tax=Monocercomonoides exilis TaxID=2049356 RepID=UPI003559F055|nr:hypothetical protein MONOS_12370 [Monocercomonoides exilis]|eukprot:MONOS_12370.1-p1 / transcript=MONOS_12370.1 / gene=MONOS_12370 / organism=Monocercomonoides_exilis_PA203 / gene_product=unspecified product / transcript_product=unspecified product / location=Mono_scaffold00680:26709-27083(+) / protein_length=125 / sequence_SO=supercontig / SO=protein_coding / is_pseudo=false